MKRRRHLTFLLSLLFVAASIAVVWATDETPLPRIETRVEKVAIFKDGYGFFTRVGMTQIENGWAEFDEIPNAVLGTIWAFTGNADERVDMLIRGTRDVNPDAKKVSILNWLRGSIGNWVSLALTDKAQVRGTLIYVSEPSATPVMHDYGESILNPEGTEILAMVRTGEESVRTIRLSQIARIQLLEPSKAGAPREVGKAPVLKAKVLAKTNDVALGLAYLEQGIRWMPSYIVTLRDNKTAIVNLRASVVNMAEDLDNTLLNLVIGVPHFSSKGEWDPIGIQKALSQLPEYRGEMSRAAMNQVAPNASQVPYGGLSAFPPTIPQVTDLSGEAMEELFLYHKEEVTLRKGESAQLDILAVEAVYKDLYQWEADSGSDVWHIARLTNTSKAPWTTGIAMSMKAGQPLGQDLLKYTPTNASTNLRITQAPDIRVSQEETETSRSEVKIFDSDEKASDSDIKEVDKKRWVLVTLSGELEVESYKNEAITIEITKTLPGKAVSVTDSAEIHIRPTDGLNASSNLKWTVTVDPRKTRVVKYQYQVYMPVQ